MKTTFLENIIAYKKQFVRKSKIREPLSYLRRQITKLPKPKRLSEAIVKDPKDTGIIAEIKRRSPSRQFNKVKDIIALAQEYEKNGASAISVLTDEKFFGGSLADLQLVKASVSIPVLRKDFIIDEYQIYQSRAYGADAVLLIAAILPEKKLMRLWRIATKLGMEVVVEVHNEIELDVAVGFLWYRPANIIGINNRDLSTLKVDLDTARRLLPLIPISLFKIVESGIHTRRQIREFLRRGADGFLIGDVLLKSRSPGKRLKELIYGKS